MTLESAASFLTWKGPAIIPVIKDMILPQGALMFIWGLQDTFKSWCVLDLAWSVASGDPWLVFPTNQHTVLLINTELPKTMLQLRMRQVAQVRGTVPANLHVVTDLNLKLDTETGMALLVRWVQECKPGLIIIDNLYRCFVGDMNKGENVNKLLDTISYIREQYHCATVSYIRFRE